VGLDATCVCGALAVAVLAVTAQDGTEKSRQVFVTIPTEVGQTEAEEIGELGAVVGRCCR
jgi:hypothetical protein